MIDIRDHGGNFGGNVKDKLPINYQKLRVTSNANIYFSFIDGDSIYEMTDGSVNTIYQTNFYKYPIKDTTSKSVLIAETSYGGNLRVVLCIARDGIAFILTRYAYYFIDLATMTKIKSVPYGWNPTKYSPIDIGSVWHASDNKSYFIYSPSGTTNNFYKIDWVAQSFTSITKPTGAQTTYQEYVIPTDDDNLLIAYYDSTSVNLKGRLYSYGSGTFTLLNSFTTETFSGSLPSRAVYSKGYLHFDTRAYKISDGTYIYYPQFYYSPAGAGWFFRGQGQVLNHVGTNYTDWSSQERAICGYSLLFPLKDGKRYTLTLDGTVVPNTVQSYNVATLWKQPHKTKDYLLVGSWYYNHALVPIYN